MSEDIAGWERYCRYAYQCDDLGISLDVSRVGFDDTYMARMREPLTAAFAAMTALEAGALANLDEDRMVGHYWLRAPQLAPRPDLAERIRATVEAVRAFAADVSCGAVTGEGGSFENLIHIGIGGSALGPQLLQGVAGARNLYVLDNADPDSVAQVCAQLVGGPGRTLVTVASKSGGTAMVWRLWELLEAQYRAAGCVLARHAVAVTVSGSLLDKRADQQGWLARFPVWDWVGGRTSVTSAVGLLPAALVGADIGVFLDGAARMDDVTRSREVESNPAALLALAWHWAGRGRGERDLVVLPYRDRLALFPRYVQQLVMESVGKRVDRFGNLVHQGLTVYGNKGETDQHSIVQQLRDGPDRALVLLLGVLDGSSDHLFASLEGTREALSQRGRDSVSLMVPDVGMRSVGALVALFERAVGLYAELIDVNAYHQPGVVTDATAATLAIRDEILAALPAEPCDAEQVAVAIGRPTQIEAVHRVLIYLTGVGSVERVASGPPQLNRFQRLKEQV